jgi:hypothetical protein
LPCISVYGILFGKLAGLGWLVPLPEHKMAGGVVVSNFAKGKSIE